MDMDNVKSDNEQQSDKKITWPNVTAKGKIALKKIQSAILNQTDEEVFKKEIMESLHPVFNEVYMLIKTNVAGYEDFLEQFPALHDLKNPNWKNMFKQATFNAANVPNAGLKQQLTDMEIRLKAIQLNMPATHDFIKVILINIEHACSFSILRKLSILEYFLRLWSMRLRRVHFGPMMISLESRIWQKMQQTDSIKSVTSEISGSKNRMR